MSLNKEFPRSPYEIIKPELRWSPEGDSKQKSLPPLVPKIRKAVHEWREKNYEGATETTKVLLNFWFNNKDRKLKYYFAQREAVESVVYLYEVVRAHSGPELRKFESYKLSNEQFGEDWARYVLKLATGSGKTKILSLIITWVYFNEIYEKKAKLSKNFLLITPNIIVLDRLKADFENLSVFFKDNVIPENGHFDKNWFDDFQLDVHIQDNVNINRAKGNIFLTNIHRVYPEGREASVDDENTMDYFLGDRVVDAKTNNADLGNLIRDVDDVVILNDEAHHIRDNEWAKAIRDIHNHLVQKDSKLSLQIDVTATPKFDKGQIFPQTVCDYPLVEAIYQRIVKHPVLPDYASQSKYVEKDSIKFVERYEDFINIGVKEWQQQYKSYKEIGKKPLLFIMVDDTSNCDEVAEYLEKNFKELEGGVLAIHTKKDGRISEGNLDKLREAANNLDKPESPYKAVVSVLVLKEGWDVKNVTTIVGLRAYGGDDEILAEQTLGRGLRKIQTGDREEIVSIIGTKNFISFIEKLKEQGVEFDEKKMGGVSEKYDPLLIEIDRDNEKKDLEKLDIELPILTPKIYRAHEALEGMDVSKILKKNEICEIKKYDESESSEIIFERAYPGDDEDREHHRLKFESLTSIDSTNLLRWFVRCIKTNLRLRQVEHILYGKMKDFIENYLFGISVDLKDPNIVRNLSDFEIKNKIFKKFETAVNENTVLQKDDVDIKSWTNISNARPFHANHQNYIESLKSVFNKTIGDSQLELDVAELLDKSNDIISYAKNYFSVNFRLDYQNHSGEISNYIPDFFIKTNNKEIYVLETKGIEDLDAILKFNRLIGWCRDVNNIQSKYKYIPLYVKDEDFRKYQKDINSFEGLIKIGTSDKLEFPTLSDI